ncbi:MAG: hypothetical protein ABH844_03245 [Candidatus Omnitrophota bacterium]
MERGRIAGYTEDKKHGFEESNTLKLWIVPPYGKRPTAFTTGLG